VAVYKFLFLFFVFCFWFACGYLNAAVEAGAGAVPRGYKVWVNPFMHVAGVFCDFEEVGCPGSVRCRFVVESGLKWGGYGLSPCLPPRLGKSLDNWAGGAELVESDGAPFGVEVDLVFNGWYRGLHFGKCFYRGGSKSCTD